MSWLRLTIETHADKVDSLTGLLAQFDANSVSYLPVSNEVLFDNQHQAEPVLWQHTSVTALLDPEIDIDILLACIRNRVGTENIHKHRIDYLQDEEWTEAYKHGFQKMVFAERLVVRPSWDHSRTPDLPTIVLDPGLAFGTGTHATTKLCLEWLAMNELREKIVIDYGCGSGILSLAAAKLGAKEVFAVDIDAQAILASSNNAEQNNLQDRIQISAVHEINLPQADILIANILFNPLIELAPLFEKLVVPGGTIVLSGLLAGQAQDCLDTYSRWFNMGLSEYRDEWSLLHGYR